MLRYAITACVCRSQSLIERWPEKHTPDNNCILFIALLCSERGIKKNYCVYVPPAQTPSYHYSLVIEHSGDGWAKGNTILYGLRQCMEYMSTFHPPLVPSNRIIIIKSKINTCSRTLRSRHPYFFHRFACDVANGRCGYETSRTFRWQTNIIHNNNVHRARHGCAMESHFWALAACTSAKCVLKQSFFMFFAFHFGIRMLEGAEVFIQWGR